MKWENKVFPIPAQCTPEELEAAFNRLGEEGWRFVQLDRPVRLAYFERPAEERALLTESSGRSDKPGASIAPPAVS